MFYLYSLITNNKIDLIPIMPYRNQAIFSYNIQYLHRPNFLKKLNSFIIFWRQINKIRPFTVIFSVDYMRGLKSLSDYTIFPCCLTNDIIYLFYKLFYRYITCNVCPCIFSNKERYYFLYKKLVCKCISLNVKLTCLYHISLWLSFNTEN